MRSPILRWVLCGCLVAALAPAATFASGPAPAVKAAAVGGAAFAPIVDDLGRPVALAAPARRVIALSPALVELTFAAGGGDRLVGAVEHSDHPPAARAVPRIGDALTLDVERLLALAPDLILAWEGGSSPRLLERLGQLGVPVFNSRIERLDDIASTLDRLSRLLGNGPSPAAVAFRARLAGLGPDPTSGRLAGPQTGPGAQTPVRVFYQVWGKPPMTVNRRHVMDDLINRCGGVNLFADAATLVPQVSIEAVVAAAPELMIASSSLPGGAADGSLDAWRRYPSLPAVRNGALLHVDADLLSRPAPRMLDAAERICAEIDRVRRAR